MKTVSYGPCFPSFFGWAPFGTLGFSLNARCSTLATALSLSKLTHPSSVEYRRGIQRFRRLSDPNRRGIFQFQFYEHSIIPSLQAEKIIGYQRTDGWTDRRTHPHMYVLLCRVAKNIDDLRRKNICTFQTAEKDRFEANSTSQKNKKITEV